MSRTFTQFKAFLCAAVMLLFGGMSAWAQIAGTHKIDVTLTAPSSSIIEDTDMKVTDNGDGTYTFVISGLKFEVMGQKVSGATLTANDVTANDVTANGTEFSGSKLAIKDFGDLSDAIFSASVNSDGAWSGTVSGSTKYMGMLTVNLKGSFESHAEVVVPNVFKAYYPFSSVPYYNMLSEKQVNNDSSDVNIALSTKSLDFLMDEFKVSLSEDMQVTQRLDFPNLKYEANADTSVIEVKNAEVTVGIVLQGYPVPFVGTMNMTADLKNKEIDGTIVFDVDVKTILQGQVIVTFGKSADGVQIVRKKLNYDFSRARRLNIYPKDDFISSNVCYHSDTLGMLFTGVQIPGIEQEAIVLIPNAKANPILYAMNVQGFEDLILPTADYIRANECEIYLVIGKDTISTMEAKVELEAKQCGKDELVGDISLVTNANKYTTTLMDKRAPMFWKGAGYTLGIKYSKYLRQIEVTKFEGMKADNYDGIESLDLTNTKFEMAGEFDVDGDSIAVKLMFADKAGNKAEYILRAPKDSVEMKEMELKMEVEIPEITIVDGIDEVETLIASLVTEDGKEVEKVKPSLIDRSDNLDANAPLAEGTTIFTYTFVNPADETDILTVPVEYRVMPANAEYVLMLADSTLERTVGSIASVYAPLVKLVSTDGDNYVKEIVKPTTVKRSDNADEDADLPKGETSFTYTYINPTDPSDVIEWTVKYTLDTKAGVRVIGNDAVSVVYKSGALYLRGFNDGENVVVYSILGKVDLAAKAASVMNANLGKGVYILKGEKVSAKFVVK